MATREQTYRDQLEAMGVWQDAFQPEIHMLSILEREHQRTLKAWKAADKTGRGGDPTDDLYPVLVQQRRDILQHRDALGLTPKAYRRMKPQAAADDLSAEAGAANSALSDLLDAIRSTAEAAHE